MDTEMDTDTNMKKDGCERGYICGNPGNFVGIGIMHFLRYK